MIFTTLTRYLQHCLDAEWIDEMTAIILDALTVFGRWSLHFLRLFCENMLRYLPLVISRASSTPN